MKIYVGWGVVCAVLCVCAHPSRDRFNEMYRLFNPISIANDYDFVEQLSATKLFEIFKNSEEFEKKGPSTMRAIVPKARTSPVLLPLIIDPEAEMLPAGYEGVKPPGVTHMELAFEKPKTRPSRRESEILRATATDDRSSGKFNRFNRDNDVHYAASKHETQVARDDRGTDSLAVFEIGGSKGDAKKEKAVYTEVSDASKSHSENDDRTKNHKKEIVKQKEATYGTRDDREKARNTAGYRNIYHKDELKKDADFYSNGHRGGHFEDHGRYGEKHAAAEGEYAKGRSNGSRFVKVEANEQKNEKKDGKPKVTLRRIPRELGRIHKADKA